MAALTRDVVQQVDRILAGAQADGRTGLLEHEVYGVLAALGLTVPKFLFVTDPSRVTEEALSPLGHTVMVKIVSREIAHKQKLGGVRKVSAVDPMFVQFVLDRMSAEVLSRMPLSPLKIDGFLLVEYIPHTQALGYEVLIGIREDSAFGPVLTVSKGGDDAEFFAQHYDPANLFLPPVDYEDALSLMRSLHIRHKFESIGHPEYLELMARAVAGMSALAYHYSPIATNPRFILGSFEVNPFAVSKDHRFVALDGLAEFKPAEAGAWAPGANGENLGAFFQPRGVAVVGVSADLSRYSLGRDIAELLHNLSRDDLFLINPKGGAIRFGETEYPLYTGISALPSPVELAVYAAPAASAPDFLRSLEGSGVKAVILIPGIPASMQYGEYASHLRAAVPRGIRVLGPNCMGVYWAPGHGRPEAGADKDVKAPAPRAGGAKKGAPHSINTLFINEQRLEVRSSPRSNAVLLTQSGALAVTVLDKLANSKPLRAVVSFGNKFDVNLSDLMAHFGGDPSIAVVAIYVEGFAPGEGRRFYDMAAAMGTPIVVYKGGRTEAGARSAASHTASMSGSYDVFKAACAQVGIIQADTIEEYYDLVKTFSLLAGRIPDGERVAGVVNAGFESTVGADELGGLCQAQLSDRTRERLNKINSSGLVDTSTPFLDVTPMTDDRQYAEYVEAVVNDPGVDCVFVAVVPHAVTLKTLPETCRDSDGLAGLLVSLSSRTSKPIVVSVNASRHYADFVAVLEEGGLPVYTDIRSAISSLDTFVSYHMGKKKGVSDAPRPGGPTAPR